MSRDVDQREAEKQDLLVLYAMDDSFKEKSKITFFGFNTKTHALFEIPNLVKELPLYHARKAVEIRQGGENWIVTSGTKGVYVRLRIIPAEKSRNSGWMKNFK